MERVELLSRVGRCIALGLGLNVTGACVVKMMLTQ